MSKKIEDTSTSPISIPIVEIQNTTYASGLPLTTVDFFFCLLKSLITHASGLPQLVSLPKSHLFLKI